MSLLTLIVIVLPASVPPLVSTELFCGYRPETNAARLGEPLTSTSANRPGQPPAPGPERIADVFADELARGELLILDGGALGNVPPSTVVDCTGPMPVLIREGALPRSELRRAVGSLAP